MERAYLLIWATSIIYLYYGSEGSSSVSYFCSRSQMIRPRGNGDGGEQAGGRRRKRPSLLAWNGGKRAADSDPDPSLCSLASLLCFPLGDGWWAVVLAIGERTPHTSPGQLAWPPEEQTQRALARCLKLTFHSIPSLRVSFLSWPITMQWFLQFHGEGR
jgi:hypothetical protein